MCEEGKDMHCIAQNIQRTLRIQYLKKSSENVQIFEHSLH